MAKTSNYTQKKKALDNAAWMNQPPHPIPIFRRGTKVSVFRGAGWSKGEVVKSSKTACHIKLEQTGNTISVYDRRSIKELS